MHQGMACVMIAQDLLGAGLFKQRMHGYLTRHAFGNASSAQLWEDLGLGREMQHWVQSSGHPVVSVTLKPDGTLSLSQRRFFASGEAEPAAPWALSLTLRRRDGRKEHIRLDGESLEVPNAADVVLVSGVFCRVHYCDASYTAAVSAAAQLDSLEAVALLDGQTALARSGLGSARRVLELLQALRGATVSAHVATAMLDAAETLRNAFWDEKRLATYQRSLAAHFLAEPSDAEVWTDVRLRCRGLAFETAQYEPLFGEWRSVPMAELAFVFRAAAMRPEHFDALLAIGRDPNADANVQRLALRELGARATDKTRLEETLLSLSSGLFRTVFLSVRVRQISWSWIHFSHCRTMRSCIPSCRSTGPPS
jgi:hypothetical protein